MEMDRIEREHHERRLALLGRLRIYKEAVTIAHPPEASEELVHLLEDFQARDIQIRIEPFSPYDPSSRFSVVLWQRQDEALAREYLERAQRSWVGELIRLAGADNRERTKKPGHFSTRPIVTSREIVEEKWPPIREELWALLQRHMCPHEAIAFLRTALTQIEDSCSGGFSHPAWEAEGWLDESGEESGESTPGQEAPKRVN